MTEQSAPFAPDWASPPGDTIADLIEERGWTPAELAERMGYSAKHVNHLVQGHAALTEDAALRLETVLGAGADFWLTREARYRGRVARHRAQAHDGDRRQRLQKHEVPVSGTETTSCASTRGRTSSA